MMRAACGRACGESGPMFFFAVEMKVGEDALFGIRLPTMIPGPSICPGIRIQSVAGGRSLSGSDTAQTFWGARLACQEMRVTLHSLLERFSTVKVVAPESVQRTGAILRGVRELVV